MSDTTDFLSWTHRLLAQLAHELNEDNKRLREENKALLEAWRNLVKEAA